MPIIPYEGDDADAADIDDIPQDSGRDGGDDAADNQLVPATGSGDKKPDDGKTEMKRAQAIATLSYYGLTDPTSQEDVAKAVQAVAAGTGDQATAVALYQMIIGGEGEGLSE